MIYNTALSRLLFVVPIGIGLLVSSCSKAPESSLIGKKYDNLAQTISEAAPKPPKKPILLSAAIGQLLQKEVIDTSLLCRTSMQKIDSVVMRLSSSLFMETDPLKIISAYNKVVFEDLALRFIDDRKNPEYLLPSQVLKNKKGSCLGISLVYLLIAEKAGIPVYGVTVPGHFFVRFDNGTVKLNIEPMKKGAVMSDEWYAERFGVSDSARDLRNLSMAEVVSLVNYNLGNIDSRNGKPSDASNHFLAAVDQMPSFAEAWGNLAIAQDKMGNTVKALEYMTKAKSCNPSLKDVDKNMGSLLYRNGEFDAALKMYKCALQRSPNDPDVHYGMASVYFQRGDFTSALNSLNLAIEERPNFSEAKLLASKVKGKMKRT